MSSRANHPFDAAALAREHVRCPLHPEREGHVFARDHRGLQLRRCRACGLMFVSPRPTFEVLGSLEYRPEYYAHTGSPGAGVAKHHETELALLERLGAGGPLLDVGVGDGAFVRHAQDRGWEVEVTDIVPYPLDPLRRDGFTTHLGPLADVRPKRLFGVVRFQQVLEHTGDPLAELQRARHLLQPRGMVYVSVPSLASLDARIKTLLSRLGLKGRPWKHFATPHHLWYFVPESLGRVVEAAGYDALHAATIPADRGRSPARALLDRALGRVGLGPLIELVARAI